MDRRIPGTILAAAIASVIGLNALTPAMAPEAANAANAAHATRAQHGPGKHSTPDRVVVIVVDALSRELVDKYRMRNVQKLMRDGADSPNGYLGHLGSVTVVTHNVITTGVLPKRMGWTSEEYRDTQGLLAGQGGAKKGDLWLTGDWTADQMFTVQKASGYPKLADYLHSKRPGSKVVTISPKGYAGYAFGGPGSDSIVTYSSAKYDCDGDGINNWRGPDGVNVPSYLSGPTCNRFYVNSDKALTYDTYKSPARLYPLDGNRYTVGKDPAHQGGDVWAADAAISVMQQEKDWSGVFVTLPGVDKSAHMWGGVSDPGPTGPDGDPMTHIKDATKVADEQVGRIMQQLRSSGDLDRTLVVLTADHGQVPGDHFHGLDDGTKDRGYNNWYYGTFANGAYSSPQPEIQKLVDTGNVASVYSDSMISVWTKSNVKAATTKTVSAMTKLPGVSAVWVRQGNRYQLAGRVRYDRMTRSERGPGSTGTPRSWSTPRPLPTART